MIESAYFEIVNKENVGLAGKFSVNPSSCENSEFYEQYLQYSALSDLRSGQNTTHLFIDETASRIMGYVSLRASTVISENSDGYMIGTPAIEVSVLAVDKDYAGSGVGRTLIDYVISVADDLHKKSIGMQYIVLASDKHATGFYEHMGFVPVESRWNKIPKKNWSVNCVPMSLLLDFEKEYITSYIDEDDEDV